MPRFDEDERYVSPWWRLSEEVSVIQATLLVLGHEPQGLADYVETKASSMQPDGYMAVKSGIVSALRNKVLDGSLYFFEYRDEHDNLREDVTRLDLSTSKVNVASLIKWLSSRGFTQGYFFSETVARRGLTDRMHPRYAPKLAAAVEAWESFDDAALGTGTVKQRLQKWLRLHAAEYGLVDDDGKPRETVIAELAGFAKGGAPKAADTSSAENLEDDEIPF